MKKVLIILGHPRTNSFCSALANSYLSGAKFSSAKTKLIEVANLKFDSNFRKEKKGQQKLEIDLIKARKDIEWANHIVFIYPLWWGFMPALLKGFIDRALTTGFAVKYIKGKPVGLLKNKSARIIITMDASPFLSQLLFGNPGIKIIKNSILKYSGFKPIKITKIGPVFKADKEKKKIWLNKVFKLGSTD